MKIKLELTEDGGKVFVNGKEATNFQRDSCPGITMIEFIEWLEKEGFAEIEIEEK